MQVSDIHADSSLGVSQDSWHYFLHQAAFSTGCSDRSGFSMTGPTGLQSLIGREPQRKGFAAFAASSTAARFAKMAAERVNLI